jgi:phosphoribosylaminoimidazole-succinocarboxamide synthase
MDRTAIRAALGNCLTDTSELGIGKLKKGKVRDAYDLGDRLLLITTDRQSAFDRVLASIPFKGQILNLISAWWFDRTKDLLANHLISVPDPCATIARKCRVFQVEFIVRGYLTGSTNTSAWTLYNGGAREICGNRLPDGMYKNQVFPDPIITPTTKSDKHDESITPAQIVSRKLMTRGQWDEAADIALELFRRGQETAAGNGLILVDTKYEMGIDQDGNLLLVDELHTPDSSRYWIAETYEERFLRNQEPENIDKEFLRLWFVQNCDPYGEASLPPAPEELVVELSSRYMRLFEMITGSTFVPPTDEPVLKRLRRNLEAAGIEMEEDRLSFLDEPEGKL